MLPFSKVFIKKVCLRAPACDGLADRDTHRQEIERVFCVEDEDRKQKTFKIPKYHGQKVDCICQILSRDLEEGERNNSLFILYNLLL